MSVQDRTENAQPLGDDDFWTVRIEIPQIGAADAHEAAVIMWRILRNDNWPELFFESANETTGRKTGTWVKQDEL